jgi:SAM-dependent methyltransferase
LDQTRFSTIAHADHRFLGPLSDAKADELMDALDLAPGDRVLDVGCGKAEFLLRLVERFGVAAVGIEPNPAYVEDARRAARERAPESDFEIHAVAAADFPARDFGLAIAMGSTHAHGGYRPALRSLARAVRRGGQVLVAEGFWRREPDPGYLAALGAERTEFSSHAGNLAAGIEEGLVPLYSRASNDDEWDHYEGLYARAVERHLVAHPRDPDHAAMRDKIRGWREAYLAWGRETLGFGYYLFRTRAEDDAW